MNIKLQHRVLINLSYDGLPKEAKHYVNCLALEASKKPVASKILEGVYESAIEANDDDIESLLSGAFIDADQSRKVGCFWYLKIKIFLFLFSLLTGIAIPKLLKKNFCLFLQSVVIASYYTGSNKSPFD